MSSTAAGGEKVDGIPEESVKVEHCLELQHVWHSYRQELEEQLQALTGDEASIRSGQAGAYKKDVFHGHCTNAGGTAYLPIGGGVESPVRKRISELYGVQRG